MNLWQWLWGCRHKRTSRVFTMRSRRGKAQESYVVCLSCGKRIPYDLEAMKQLA